MELTIPNHMLSRSELEQTIRVAASSAAESGGRDFFRRWLAYAVDADVNYQKFADAVQQFEELNTVENPLIDLNFVYGVPNTEEVREKMVRDAQSDINWAVRSLASSMWAEVGYGMSVAVAA
jgi:hypothetical protein